MPDAHKNPADVAWAAGLFEGEGCILVGTQRGRWPRVVVTLGSTDRDVLERFVLVVGVGKIRTKISDNPAWKDFHTWAISGRQTQPVIEMLLPWLGDRRAGKAREALLAIRGMGTPNGDKTHCPQGHPFDDANTRYWKGQRRCRACENGRSRARWKARRARSA